MNIGIFSRTYADDARAAFAAMRAQGLTHTHYNLLTSGLETMPDHVDEEALQRTCQEAGSAGIVLDGLSGTFNMIAPDEAEREDGIRRFPVLCRIARLVRTPMISLCTGSKNPKSKWEWDDRNLLPSSWEDLLRTTERILPAAVDNGIVLGVETEASNVINTPQKARAYLDHFDTPHLKIIMDGANLFLPHQVSRMHEVLDEAFSVLGADIVQAHAKDLARTPGIAFVAAGEGQLDFVHYVRLLQRSGYHGPLILHSLSVEQIPASVSFLRGVLNDAGL